MRLSQQLKNDKLASRATDARIARSIGWGCVMRDPQANHQWICWRKEYRSGEWIVLPGYTTNTDDAFTIVPKGWFVDTLAEDYDGLWWCSLVRPVEGDPETGKITRHTKKAYTRKQPTAALAVATAAIEAQEIENE